MQSDTDVAPDVVLYVPCGHGVHAPVKEYVPAGHVVHEADDVCPVRSDPCPPA